MTQTRKHRKRRKRRRKGRISTRRIAGDPYSKYQSKRGKTPYLPKRTTKKMHSTTRLSQTRTKIGQHYNNIMKNDLHLLDEKKDAFDAFLQIPVNFKKEDEGELCINTKINPENRNLSLKDFKKKLANCSIITVLTMMLFLQSQLKRMDNKHYSNKDNLNHRKALESEYKKRISDLEEKIKKMKTK